MPPLPQLILGQVHNPRNCCSIFRGEFRTHLRTVTPISFLFHCGTQWRGDTSTVLHSQPSQQRTHVSSIRPYAQTILAPFQCSSEIDSFSSPCRHLVPQALFPIHTISRIVSSATSDLHVVLCTANRPDAHKRECLVSHVGTHQDG